MWAMCVTRIQEKAKHKASSVSVFYVCSNYLINIFIWVLACLFDPAHKDVVSACRSVLLNLHLGSQWMHSYSTKCIASWTKDLTRERKQWGLGVACLHMPADRKREAKALYTLIKFNVMRKTSTAKTKTVGKIKRRYCTIYSWGNSANRAFFVETGSVKEIWELFALPAKKGLSHGRKMALKSTNQSLEK